MSTSKDFHLTNSCDPTTVLTALWSPPCPAIGPCLCSLEGSREHCFYSEKRDDRMFGHRFPCHLFCKPLLLIRYFTGSASRVQRPTPRCGARRDCAALFYALSITTGLKSHLDVPEPCVLACSKTRNPTPAVSLDRFLIKPWEEYAWGHRAVIKPLASYLVDTTSLLSISAALTLSAPDQDAAWIADSNLYPTGPDIRGGNSTMLNG